LEPGWRDWPQHCVVLRLIEKQIESSGKCPVTKEELTKDSIESTETVVRFEGSP
jgi:hypothetical protein